MRLFWILAVVAIVAAAMALTILSIVVDAKALTRGLIEVVVPGQATLHLARAGRYTIYLESQAVVNGRIITSGGSTDIACRLRSRQNRAEIPIEPSPFREKFQLGSRTGQAVAGFVVDRPGDYALSCIRSRGGGSSSSGVFAISGSLTRGLFIMIAKIFALAFEAIIGAIVVAVLIIKRRRPSPAAGVSA